MNWVAIGALILLLGFLVFPQAGSHRRVQPIKWHDDKEGS